MTVYEQFGSKKGEFMILPIPRFHQLLSSLTIFTVTCSVYADGVKFDRSFNEPFFTSIYKSGSWGSSESKSGPGSSLLQTQQIRVWLPEVLKQLHLFCKQQTPQRPFIVGDFPCGDCNWIMTLDMPFIDQYVGVDIVADAIRDNITKYGTRSHCIFMHRDLITEELPPVYVIICRDCLTHLPYSDIFAVLRNFKKCGAEFLLASTYPGRTNADLIGTSLLHMWRYRPLDMCAAPFNFPEPIVIVNEGDTEGGISDKSLALWYIKDLPIPD